MGQPHATWWNLIGFATVGMLLAGFGLAYGHILHDRLAGGLLALFGVGFGAAGVPADLADAGSTVSKAHVVAICLGLAAWLFGLARMAHGGSRHRTVHYSANVAAALIVTSLSGS